MRKRGQTWQLRVYLGVDPATGRKRYKSVTVRGTKKEAEAALNRLVAEVERGAWADAGKLTVGEYLRRWFDTHAPKLAPSTQRRYRVALEMHLIPGLGHLPLSKLSPAHIEEFLTRDRAQRRDRKTGELSSSTALYHYRVLHKAMEQALRWGLIARNPCDAVEPPRRAATRFPTLGEEQARAVLKAMAGTNVYMPTLLALATGMRLGEILALRWEDVDLENGIISVRQTLYCPRKGEFVFKLPKSETSRRAIEIGRDLAAALKKHRAEQAAVRLKAGEFWQDYGLVCCREDGRPMLPQSVSSRFRTLAARAGLRLRFHDLRHAHDTLLARHGVSPKVLSARLGHSGIGITHDLYAHVLPGAQKEAARWIESALLDKA